MRVKFTAIIRVFYIILTCDFFVYYYIYIIYSHSTYTNDTCTFNTIQYNTTIITIKCKLQCNDYRTKSVRVYKRHVYTTKTVNLYIVH